MYADPRTAYLESTVSTASPARLLIMLVDRLVLDVQRGLDAQRDQDFDAAHRHLTHAQEIVIELSSTLRVDACPGGAGLAELYRWLTVQLIQANVTRDVAVTETSLALAAELAQMWRDAALQHAAVPAP
jgi:flagellar protein FliS